MTVFPQHTLTVSLWSSLADQPLAGLSLPEYLTAVFSSPVFLTYKISPFSQNTFISFFTFVSILAKNRGLFFVQRLGTSANNPQEAIYLKLPLFNS